MSYLKLDEVTPKFSPFIKITYPENHVNWPL